MKRLFESCVIPDAELNEYLKDKLLVRPDYGYSTEHTSVPYSDWLKRKIAEDEDRKKRNNGTKRGYRL